MLGMDGAVVHIFFIHILIFGRQYREIILSDSLLSLFTQEILCDDRQHSTTVIPVFWYIRINAF